MLTLINNNRMVPPIAPIGLDYVASAVRAAGFEVELLDLALATDPAAALASHFRHHSPELVGLTFRNVDDCFWPSATSFLPQLDRDVAAVRACTNAPIVLGGVGYSIFSRPVLERTGADFGVRGDGELALASLLNQWHHGRNWHQVPGLVYRDQDRIVANAPAWPHVVDVSSKRDVVDNATYFRRGGQIGVETKRGCRRKCIYCADPVAKGGMARVRPPSVVAQEIDTLWRQGIDVLHLCDPEFNLPIAHATAVCEELIRRGLGERVRWYAYLAVLPFPESLAALMRRAGCAGINFTSDSAHESLLRTYRQPHRATHLSQAVQHCRRHGLAVMLDMLLGGPGETAETVADTIAVFKRLDPDCAGAALGARIYPETELAAIVQREGPLESNPNLRRRYTGPVDFLEPTFYISSRLGERPAEMVRELIGQDPRFFPPQAEIEGAVSSDHNYNDNRLLVDLIAAGERGAYWDILRRGGRAAPQDPV
jgi:radical SAM superfamily enzyme YgiQ (UPF0313 family)